MKIDIFEKQPIEKQQKVINTGILQFANKAYQDVSTDTITRECEISKGLLFHYFGSKKNYYLYCLEKALQTLMTGQEVSRAGGFYEILFSFMDTKIKLCKDFVQETHFVNMASRENAGEVVGEIAQLMGKYKKIMEVQSMITMRTALSALHLKKQDEPKVMEGLLMYTNAIIQKYLLAYQETPDSFFEHAEMIQAEMKDYMELMMNGIRRSIDE